MRLHADSSDCAILDWRLLTFGFHSPRASIMTVKPSKDEAARSLITWHFEIEPEMTEIYRIRASNEDDPHEPIRLLEVNERSVDTGKVQVFGFRPSKEIPYPSHVAEVTPEEMQRILQRLIPLPEGWDLDRAERYPRPEAGNGGRSN